MICQKDLFHHLICLFSIKETFVSLSENIDLIDLCYLLGEWCHWNDVQNCGSIRRKSRGLGQSRVQSIRLVETTVNRESVQSLRSLSTTTNIRRTLESTKSNDQCLASDHRTCPRQNHCTYGVSKTNLHSILADLFEISSLDRIKKSFNEWLFNTNISGRKPLLICYSNRFQQEVKPRRLQWWRKKRVNAFIEREFFPWLFFFVVFKDIIRAKFEKLFSSKTSTEKLTTDELTQSICRITTFYQKLIQTLTELRLQILCGKTFISMHSLSSTEWIDFSIVPARQSDQ